MIDSHHREAEPEVIADAGPEVTVVVLGCSGVGKSSLVRRLTNGSFKNLYTPTAGIEYDAHTLRIAGNALRMRLWDGSGDAAFQSVVRDYVSRADAVIFVYDVTQAESLRALVTWLRLSNECARWPNLPRLVVGNKTDAIHRKVISSSTGKRFAIPEGMTHMEASARNGHNVLLAFHLVATEILYFRRSVRMLAAPPLSRNDVIGDDVTRVDYNVTPPSFTHLFRILLLGSVRTGKTALHDRFCRGCYTPQYYATTGLHCGTRTVFIDGDCVNLQLWDASGNDVYESVRHESYGAADGFIIVYDVTEPKTFRHAQHILKELALRGQSNSTKVLVGNKEDLAERRLVDQGVSRAWADGWRVPFFETSARRGDNAEAPFMKLAVCLKRQHAPWKRVYDFT